MKKVLRAIISIMMVIAVLSCNLAIAFASNEDETLFTDDNAKSQVSQDESVDEVMQEEIAQGETESETAAEIAVSEDTASPMIEEYETEFASYCDDAPVDEAKLSACLNSLKESTDGSPIVFKSGDEAAKKADPSAMRYTVLVMDTSATAGFLSNGTLIYEANTAISYVKSAAKSFLQDVVGAGSNNQIAIVEYKDKANVVSGFTNDTNLLLTKVNALTADSKVRSIEDGLAKAQKLLDGVRDANAIKNVVLITTGMTNNGKSAVSGKYNSGTIGSNWCRIDTKINLYKYANAAISTAEKLKKDATVYVLGLFQTMSNMPSRGKEIATFFRLTASDLASGSDCFYPVEDPSNLKFVFGDVLSDISTDIKKISFRYDKDFPATCYYSDRYFAQPAEKYSPSLATMSISLAMSAFGSTKADYPNKSKNARQLMQDIGVAENDIVTNDWFTKVPTMDSIAVIVGSKKIVINDEESTLIMAAVRGGGYEKEWASNFTIGEYGQHKGFKEAKENVLKKIREYITDKGISGKVKFWITGYSRAAATSNLVGGALDDGVLNDMDISYDKDDVYAYCFETPAGALTSDNPRADKYNNIFNIVNPNDPVPYVAPSYLGFTRYGVDRFIPTEATSVNYKDERAKMLKIYKTLDNVKGDDYIVDDFQMKKISAFKPHIVDDTKNNYPQSVFLSNYITIVAKEFLQSRSIYVNTWQDGIREICNVMFGNSKRQELIDAVVKRAKENWKDLLASYIWNTGINPWGSEDKALQIVSDWLNDSIKEVGITGYDSATIDRAGKRLGDLILALVSNHPNYFSSAVLNASGLGAAHYPELCYSWLASMDRNYDSSASNKMNNGGFRMIRINCDVDVDVINRDGKTVAKIVKEVPQNISNSSVISGVNDDGEKIVILPAEDSYNINIKCRNDDTVDYGICEYNPSVGAFTRVENYYDVPVAKGESLKGIVPAYDYDELVADAANMDIGSNADYQLKDADGDFLYQDERIIGMDADDAYQTVQVVVNDTELGSVVGGGVHLRGSHVKLEAEPRAGCAGFDGWYDENDDLISMSTSYRFRVERDMVVTAKFAAYPNIISANAATLIVGDKCLVDIPGVKAEEIVTKGKAGIYEDGYFTAVKKGKQKLFIMNGNKKIAICTINVLEPKFKATKELKIGKSAKLKLTGVNLPVDAWYSTDSSVAVVDAGGNVVALKPGRSVIVAKVKNHNYDCTVVVKSNDKSGGKKKK